jgi:chaperone BCS1
MDTLWTFFEEQLSDNSFFSGGLILMVGGALLAACRQLPMQAWDWLRSQLVIEVDVLDRDPAFDWIDQWLASHRYSQSRARCLSVRTRAIDPRQREADPTGDHRPQILFTPAPGRHWLFYRGRLVVLYRLRPDMNQAQSQPVNVRESFSLTLFTRNRELVRQLLADARDVAIPASDTRLTIYRNGTYASWCEQLQRMPRPPESVVLREGVMESLLSDCREFLRQRNWYVERGIPYRRGTLLFGPPGTGKSSAVVAIASALRMDIAVLNLGSSQLDDTALSELLSELPSSAMLLVEDVDCVFVERQATDEKTNRVTFSGLLNALDGVAAGEGRMLFATTNHRERLDPALIRPGRIDRQVEVGLADREQLVRIFRRFYPESAADQAERFAMLVPDKQIAMSAVQTYLIQHSGSAEDACRGAAAWARHQLREGGQSPGLLAAAVTAAIPATPFCAGL